MRGGLKYRWTCQFVPEGDAKYVVGLIATAVLASILVGCGTDSSSSSKKRSSVARIESLDWSYFELSSSGRSLKVRYETNLTSPLAKVDLRESKASVVVSLFKKAIIYRDQSGREFQEQTLDQRLPCVRIPLSSRLGRRRVLRGVTGRSSRPAKERKVREPCLPPPRLSR
jgi:hypothetical protein